MQAVMSSSKKRFIIERQADPVDFWSWLVNALHVDLTAGRSKKTSIITQCFQVREADQTRPGRGRAAGGGGYMCLPAWLAGVCLAGWLAGLWLPGCLAASAPPAP